MAAILTDCRCVTEGFSAAAQLQKVRSTGAAVGISAPAAEEETVPVIRQDTVASRVQDLYDKIRADPDSATGRDLAVSVLGLCRYMGHGVGWQGSAGDGHDPGPV